MRITVDADACPVKEIILETAKKYDIPVTMVTDTSHIMYGLPCETVTVDKGRDSADIAIANRVQRGDISVTQDYGLACMLMAKGAHVINQNGFLYTDKNIDELLMRRHISSKQRRGGKRSGHVKPRTAEDDERFRECLEGLVKRLMPFT
ncbi:MAG: YaiI/YqxD family protein [Clostridia bacterium]|nr:YaiI/YqxD family protein [Clostridia bacterium]